MKSALKPQGKTCTHATKHKGDAILTQPKLSDRYIVVCPAFFNEVIKEHLDRIDTVIMREDKTRYLDHDEDEWSNLISDDDYYAEVFITKTTSERLVYFPSQGKLFSCKDIIQAGRILDELKTQEDLKIIS